MRVILIVFLGIYLGGGAFAQADQTCSLVLNLSEKRLVRHYEQQVQYITRKGVKIPYLDVNPKGRKTVVLIAGFSHSFLVWSKHIKNLEEQGYRVIAVENSNVGLNLRENGILDLKANTGIYFDSLMYLKVLQKLRPKGAITVAGHSRGGGVAAALAKRLSRTKMKVKKVKLMSPYVRYIWSQGLYNDSVFKWWLNSYPGLVGQGLTTEGYADISDDIIGVDKWTRQKGYAYVLKALQPNFKSEEFQTKIELEDLSEKITISVLGAVNDTELTPPDVLKTLESEKIKVHLLAGDDYTHYWPMDFPEHTVSFIIN